MHNPPARIILLFSKDVRRLDLAARELRAMGCPVFCARDLEQAAALVCAGLTTRVVLLRLGDDFVSRADLRAAMAARLPGWLVQCDELDDERIRDGAPDRLVN